MPSTVYPFSPAAMVDDPTEVDRWRAYVDGFVPGWVTRWLDSHDNPLQPARQARLMEGKKSSPEQRSSSWLAYLMEMSSYYGYSGDTVLVSAALWGTLPPVELQHHRVQDLSLYLPPHLCRNFFVLPFSRVGGTGLVNCAVLEPAFLPFVEEFAGWVRGRWISGSPVATVRPAVFQYFLAEPKAFFTFLSSVERANLILPAMPA